MHCLSAAESVVTATEHSPNLKLVIHDKMNPEGDHARMYK